MIGETWGKEACHDGSSVSLATVTSMHEQVRRVPGVDDIAFELC